MAKFEFNFEDYKLMQKDNLVNKIYLLFDIFNDCLVLRHLSNYFMKTFF